MVIRGAFWLLPSFSAARHAMAWLAVIHAAKLPAVTRAGVVARPLLPLR
jgi:hypothetical protein